MVRPWTRSLSSWPSQARIQMVPTKVEKKLKTVLNPVTRTKQRLREQSVVGERAPGTRRGRKGARVPPGRRDSQETVFSQKLKARGELGWSQVSAGRLALDAHPGTAHGRTVGSVRGKKASVETARAFLGKSLLVQATRSLALDAFLGASGWWRPQDSSWFWREVGSSGGRWEGLSRRQLTLVASYNL